MLYDAEWCEKKHKALTVHHLDRDKDNHDLGNLLTLCVVCHGKIHGLQASGMRENYDLL
jgi:hypothetical protein